MSNWKERAEIVADVVFFDYSREVSEGEFNEVFVWDLDKTYLDTHWGSVKDLIRTAFEKAFQKRNVP